MEVALTCKEFLLQDKCNELAEKLFKDSFEKIKSESTKNIFDPVEKIHDCKESIKVLERNISSSDLKMEELKIKEGSNEAIQSEIIESN